MRPAILPLLASIATLSPLAIQQAQAQLFTPVQIQYTCPTQTGTLPTCTTTYTLPAHRLLTVQFVSGSATPITPNAAGNFATGQASLTVSTELGSGPSIPNIIGPNYAIGNTAIWFYDTPTTFYTDQVPVIANNGGPVLLQGYLTYK